MDPLEGYWLIVERGVVLGTMDLSCFSKPTVDSLGFTPRAGCVDPLLGSSLGGFWVS